MPDPARLYQFDPVSLIHHDEIFFPLSPRWYQQAENRIQSRRRQQLASHQPGPSPDLNALDLGLFARLQSLFDSGSICGFDSQHVTENNDGGEPEQKDTTEEGSATLLARCCPLTFIKGHYPLI